MREPQGTAKAVAKFVPHCATSVHMGLLGCLMPDMEWMAARDGSLG